MSIKYGTSALPSSQNYISKNLSISETCYPEQKQAELSPLEEGIRNRIIKNPYCNISFEGNLIMEEVSYTFHPYEPKPDYNGQHGIKSEESIAQLLQREDIKVIRIYEMGKSGQPLAEPSLSIFKDLKIAEDKKINYLVFNLYSANDLHYGDCNVLSTDKLDADMVFEAGDYIVRRRFWNEVLDKLKKGGRITIFPPKPPMRKI